jgi:RNA polymerase sigma-70 factor, ECF subfamily
MIQLTNAEVETAKLQSLLKATAAGDQIAFSEFYDLTKRKLFGIAISIMKRPDLAEEVVQDTYVKIWRHASKYDPAKSSPITWSVKIARNHAIDILRRKDFNFEPSDQAILRLSDHRETALDALEAADKRGHALAALRSLTPHQRSLIVAAYLHGESREQLATRYGAPVGTIKTWLHRALLKVQMSVNGHRPQRRWQNTPSSDEIAADSETEASSGI